MPVSVGWAPPTARGPRRWAEPTLPEGCPTRRSSMGAVSSPLQELAEAAESARSFRIETTFDLPGGKGIKVYVWGDGGQGRWVGYWNVFPLGGTIAKAT